MGNSTPILDREKKIVSIDGGNILRIGGQLNLLIIPDANKEQFCFRSADLLPSVQVIRRQSGTENSVYVPWQESGVELLKRGEEFSLCRQLSSGRELWVANRDLLDFPDGTLHCREATDHFLDVVPGDFVKLIYRCRERSYCKKQGRMGWVENACLDPEGPVSSGLSISPVFPL